MTGPEVFKDHFSGLAAGYRCYRPRYPASLFDYLATLTPRRGLVWDCATGSGQAARALASRFELVCATDASASQLARAIAHPRIVYRLAPADSVPLADESVDLVTVGQALHWFDVARFFDEVRRVLRQGGIIGVWSYGVVRVAPEIDALVDHLYRFVLGNWWPPERRLIDAGREGLDVPFREVDVPPFRMIERWTRDEFVGYLRTWSAVARYRAATGQDPLAPVASELARTWPDGLERRAVTWPFHLRVAARGE